FTSLYDDSVGGDTNTDGDDTKPENGTWSGIRVSDGGAVKGSTVVVRYANTGVSAASISTVQLSDSRMSNIYGSCLDVSGADSVSYFHGVLRDCVTGIYSSSLTYFDASSVDWGGSLGPGMDGNPSSSPVVAVFPWVGAPIPPPQPPAPAPRTVKSAEECNEYLFLGVRGSGQDPPVAGDPRSGYGREVEDVKDGFTTLRSDTKTLALSYSANAVPLTQDSWKVWNWLGQIGDFQPSAWSGSVELMQQIERAVDECGESGQKIVIVGYSQGAWAVHAALNYLHASKSDLLEHVSAVGLIADPLRSSSNALRNEGSAKAGIGVAVSGLGNVAVSYNDMITQIALHDFPAVPATSMSDYRYPSQLAQITREYCDDMDLVCDYGNLMDQNSQYLLGLGIAGAFKAGSDVHTAYPEFGLFDLGKSLAAIAG
ncbi:cutinase family protein, partial [Microbacterium sp. VKM Ac-2923]|uniref:cutinase family protein n=1 Tax=Microbacterium sp. VKM Ac-2923 TaxID=2929476 RepID=UPI001FB50A5C